MLRARIACLVLIVAGGCQTAATPIDDEPAGHPVASPLGRGILMPLQREPHVAPPHANVANNRLHYYGGRVLAKPQIVQVLWGAGVSAELATGMADFYRNTLQSPYMDWLGEYDTINVATNLRLGTGTTTET